MLCQFIRLSHLKETSLDTICTGISIFLLFFLQNKYKVLRCRYLWIIFIIKTLCHMCVGWWLEKKMHGYMISQCCVRIHIYTKAILGNNSEISDRGPFSSYSCRVKYNMIMKKQNECLTVNDDIWTFAKKYASGFHSWLHCRIALLVIRNP